MYGGGGGVQVACFTHCVGCFSLVVSFYELYKTDCDKWVYELIFMIGCLFAEVTAHSISSSSSSCFSSNFASTLSTVLELPIFQCEYMHLLPYSLVCSFVTYLFICGFFFIAQSIKYVFWHCIAIEEHLTVQHSEL